MAFQLASFVIHILNRAEHKAKQGKWIYSVVCVLCTLTGHIKFFHMCSLFKCRSSSTIMQVRKCLWCTKPHFFLRCKIGFSFIYATNSSEYVLNARNFTIEFDFIAKVLHLLKSNLCNPSQARTHSKFQVNCYCTPMDPMRCTSLFIYSDCWLIQTKHLHAIEAIYICEIWNR